MGSSMAYETFVSPGVERLNGTLPTGERLVSSPITSTLVYGRDEAVLVDPPLTMAQTRGVVDWVRRKGKTLRYVYVTHGHGDHWFGTRQVLETFPEARVYATPGTIKLMARQASEGRQRNFDKDFPGQIGDTNVSAEAIPPGGLQLETERLVPVEVGHSDTDDTTVLHVSALDLVVAGDVVYNGIHQYLLEAGGEGLDAWLMALDRVEDLKPRAVVAGHKNQRLPDDPRAIGETRRYLLDAKRLIAKRIAPIEFYEEMLALYPDRLNRGPLWYGGLGLLTPSASPASSTEAGRETATTTLPHRVAHADVIPVAEENARDGRPGPR